MSISAPIVDGESPLTIVVFEYGQPRTVIDVGNDELHFDRRAYHALPPLVLDETRNFSQEVNTSLSRAALLFQMAGLAWIVAHVQWDTLFAWRRPHGNPRAPHDLGIPEPWLNALREEPAAAVSPEEHLFRPDVSPITYPTAQNTLYSQPTLWHRVVQEAARPLMVPAGHLLGVMQTAGLLTYHLDLPPIRGMLSSGLTGTNFSRWLSQATLVLAQASTGKKEEAIGMAMDIIESLHNRQGGRSTRARRSGTW